MKEKVIEQALTREVKKAGGLCYKWASPGNTGVPDRIVIYGGMIKFIELKAPGKKPTPKQEYIHAQLREQGASVYVIDSLEGVKTLIKALL